MPISEEWEVNGHILALNQSEVQVILSLEVKDTNSVLLASLGVGGVEGQNYIIQLLYYNNNSRGQL